MTFAPIVLAALLAAPTLEAPTTNATLTVDTCVECHAEQSDKALSRQVKPMKADVHGRAGFSCHDCHGGDPTTGMDDPYESMDPKKGYVGIPGPGAVAGICAKCHERLELMSRFDPSLPTDQRAKFAVSQHGVAAAAGHRDTATCVSCHGAHGIERVSSPASGAHRSRVADTCGTCHADPRRMARSRLPVNQLAEYRDSVHWEAAASSTGTAAPLCHDCHGNHLSRAPRGADIALTCGKCHTAEAEAFGRGKHRSLPGFRACAECHGNHRVTRATDGLLEAGGPCFRCHADATTAARRHVEAVSREIRGLAAELERAVRANSDMMRHGIPTADVEDAARNVREQLMMARRLVHGDSLVEIRASVARGVEGLERVRFLQAEAQRQLRQRRLATLLFAAFSALFASMLWLRFRVDDRQDRPSSRA